MFQFLNENTILYQFTRIVKESLIHNYITAVFIQVLLILYHGDSLTLDIIVTITNAAIKVMLNIDKCRTSFAQLQFFFLNFENKYVCIVIRNCTQCTAYTSNDVTGVWHQHDGAGALGFFMKWHHGRYLETMIHSFISGMHHYECVPPNIDINLQSGWFWAKSIASFRERLKFSRSCYILVFIHVVQGRPGGLLQFCRGKLLRSLHLAVTQCGRTERRHAWTMAILKVWWHIKKSRLCQGYPI